MSLPRNQFRGIEWNWIDFGDLVSIHKQQRKRFYIPCRLIFMYKESNMYESMIKHETLREICTCICTMSLEKLNWLELKFLLP